MNDDQNASEGIVYLINNPLMPGLVKIGSTTDLKQRIQSLYTRSPDVPSPFECQFAKRVNYYRKVEITLHNAFGDHRVNPKREWFRIEPARAQAIFSLLEGEEIILDEKMGTEDKSDEQVLEKASQRASRFNFDIVGIKSGDELTSTINPNIKAKVLDNTKIILNGEIVSLTEGARRVAVSKGLRDGAYQGPRYWEYNNKILTELRDEMEQG